MTYSVPSGQGGNYYIEVTGSPLTSQPTTGDYVLAVRDATINHAPTLNTSVAPTLPNVAENSNGGLGDLVSTILATGAGGNPISDADAGAVQGIAITQADSTDGTWQYSTNAGATWTAFPAVSTTNALLLAANSNTRIRYVPASSFSGTINDAFSFQAWDQTSGTNGGTADTSISGGTTAFSTGVLSASLPWPA